MAQENEKDLYQLKNRFRDLADRAYAQNVYTFTGFLGLGEQDVFRQNEGLFRHVGYRLYGGYEGADRVMLRFGDEEQLGYEMPFPIVCVHIEPLQKKFAEELSHRDFLGALMNLGIERSTIGDIKVGEKEAFLFCQDTIKQFICENLQQIRHTHVRCSVTDAYSQIPEEEPEHITVQVQSPRIDGILAKVYHLSREKSLELFRTGRVYVNGRLCENNSRTVKDGEVINARGFGKCKILGEPGQTRKGKLALEIALYR